MSSFVLLRVSFVGLVVMLAAHARSQEPTAASLAFTTQDSVTRQARELMAQGLFTQAESTLRSGLEGSNEEASKARAELLEIISRVRYEYSLKPEALLKKLQTTIPTTTLEEMQSWASESSARTRTIDGQVYYFRREPQNIFLFSRQAQQRRAQSGRQPSSKQWPLVDHLAQVVQAGQQSSTPEVLPVHHRVTHTLKIRPGHPAIKPGAMVRVWLPFAQEYRQQRDVKLVSATPQPKMIAPNAVDGPQVSQGAQRTVYFEQIIDDVQKPLVFTEVIEFTSYAYYPKLDEQQVQPLPASWNNAYLTERFPHIVFDPAIASKTREIIGQEKNPLLQARLIFRWVSHNIPWNAEDEYCTIPSLAMKGFQARRGDCGVQNTLFITMCRIAGIPARWQSGFETKPGENWACMIGLRSTLRRGDGCRQMHPTEFSHLPIHASPISILGTKTAIAGSSISTGAASSTRPNVRFDQSPPTSSAVK